MNSRFQQLLRWLVEKKGSDLHLSVGRPPQLRINGELVDLAHEPLTHELCAEMITQILDPQHWQGLRVKRELDFSFNVEGIGRFRANIFWERGNLAAALRLIPTQIPTFEELGLPAAIMSELASQPMGLVLVAGPTGSGKSTTLAAMIDYINESRRCHVISIEDPVEFMHTHKKATVVQRELGNDTRSFAHALRGVLREDPDVVVIGEMRDLETISSALRVAETGHLVLSTIHCGTATNAISRMIDVFPAQQQSQIRVQLSLTLQAVIVQQLLSRIDGSVRALATEVMIVTPAIRNLMRDSEPEQIYSHIQMGSSLGMRTMNASLAELYKNSQISLDTALARSPNEKEILNMLPTVNAASGE